MVAGCGAKVAKFLLFIINFCVWAVGIVLIGVGAYVMVESDKYSYLFGDQDTLTTVAGIIIGTGCFIFLVGFCACCGAIKEVICLLQVYFVLIVLVIILEVVAAILAFVFQNDLTDVVQTSMTKAIMEDYNGVDGNAATDTIDLVQKEFECCGGEGPADWDNSNWKKDPANLLLAAPISCCKKETTGCNVGALGVAPGIYTKGCVTAFQGWLKDNYLIVGGVCLGLLVFEILALVFTCCLISGIRKGD
ncbi:CD63 antigen-like [Amphiura filiformis]|uniref:CD63 antigen-like n=1 Tax=Amphiura filiformis TaxID=82378 RepID=UPI003B210AB1